MPNLRSLARYIPAGVLILTVACTAGFVFTVQAGDDKYERGRMEDILDVVAKDIQKNFYDPNLKGRDWKSIVDKAHQRIRQADHLGDMLSAIASVPYQLNDSHTYFIPPGRSARVDYGFDAEPFGQDILVYKLRKEGPAVKAGLQLGDKIVVLDGFQVKRENFFEMTRYFEFLNPAIEMDLEVMRGSEGPLTIKIPAKVEQKGKTYFMDYNEIRRMIDAQEPTYIHRDYEGKVGYIRLRTFMLSPGDVEPMMNKLRNSSAVIIDLRKNGGGARETLAALAGCFTEQPYEMAKQVGRDKSEALLVKPAHPKINAPVFVLIDSSSASASEMLARDLQLHNKAVVVGDTSSGRVNMARIFWEKVGAFDMVGFGAEIAVSRVVMDNGDELENKGVTPDEVCIPTASDLRQEKDPCLDHAVELARRAGGQQERASHPN